MDTSSEDKGYIKLTKPLFSGENFTKVLLGVFVVSLILGGITGFVLGNKPASKQVSPIVKESPKSASQDTRTFRDFAEGVIKPQTPSADGEYVEGTHILQRDGAYPVALTSSVVDLSKYEGKKVKVYGETQKALKEGWLMDVGKVEEIK